MRLITFTNRSCTYSGKSSGLRLLLWLAGEAGGFSLAFSYKKVADTKLYDVEVVN